MKRSHIREIGMEVVVGAFMFMILLALGFFTIILSYENIFTPTHHVYVRFEHVRGLRQGDNVFMRGVQVGRVRTLEFQEDGVRVHASLDYPPTLYENYRVEILPSSILGGQYLSLYEGTSDHPRVDLDTELRGKRPVDIMDEATTTVRALREALEDGGILENLESVMLQLNRITTDIAEGRGTLGRMITDDALYENLTSATEDIKLIAARLERGEGTIGKLMTDETVYENVSRISDDLALISRRIAAGEGMIGRLLSEDDTLYEDLAASAAALRRITVMLAEGEGTLGRMLTDDDLYEDAKMLIQEIRGTIDDIRETAPLTTFTSVFFGAF